MKHCCLNALCSTTPHVPPATAFSPAAGAAPGAPRIALPPGSSERTARAALCDSSKARGGTPGARRGSRHIRGPVKAKLMRTSPQPKDALRVSRSPQRFFTRKNCERSWLASCSQKTQHPVHALDVAACRTAERARSRAKQHSFSFFHSLKRAAFSTTSRRGFFSFPEESSRPPRSCGACTSICMQSGAASAAKTQLMT